MSIFDKKKVALVGPAGYTLDYKFGVNIDSCDVVARFIRSLPIDKAHIGSLGSKTDVVVSSLICDRGIFYVTKPGVVNPEYIEIIEENGNILMCPFYVEYNAHIGIAKATLSKNTGVSLMFRDENKTIQTNKDLDSHATTGLAAICNILDYDIDELYLTGFTFDPNYPRISNYQDRINFKQIFDTTGWHSLSKEKVFFKKLLKKDKRIKIDPFMKRIFEG